VVNFRLHSLYSPEKHPLSRRLNGPEPLWTILKRERTLAPAGTRTTDRPARSLVAMPSTPPRSTTTPPPFDESATVVRRLGHPVRRLRHPRSTTTPPRSMTTPPSFDDYATPAGRLGHPLSKTTPLSFDDYATLVRRLCHSLSTTTPLPFDDYATPVRDHLFILDVKSVYSSKQISVTVVL
jgi:hypothetical protein